MFLTRPLIVTVGFDNPGMWLQIIPSRDVKVAGLLGPAAPIDKKTIAVADTAIGMGGTTCWRLAGQLLP